MSEEKKTSNWTGAVPNPTAGTLRAMEKEEKRFAELLLKGELEEVVLGLEQGLYSRGELDLPLDSEGSTPLISACQMGLTGVMRFLLDQGVDATLCNLSHQTVLHVSQPGLREELLSAMLRPLSHEARLLEASWRGDIHGLQHLLAQTDALDVNVQNRDGLTPLMLVVRDVDLFEGLQGTVPWEYRPTEVVKALLALSANAEAEDQRGYTALHHASQIKSPIKGELLKLIEGALPQSVSAHVELVCHFPTGRSANSPSSSAPCDLSNPVDVRDVVDVDEDAAAEDLFRQDKIIALCFPSPMESRRSTRRGFALSAATGWTSSLPSLRDRNNCPDKPGPWSLTSEVAVKTALIPIPPKLPAEKHKAITESPPVHQYSQLSRSAPSLTLLNSSVLLQVRANIQNRLGSAEIVCENIGQKAPPPVLSPRTPKKLAPLDRGNQRRPALSSLQCPWQLEPISILSCHSRSRRRTDRLSRGARRDSEESCSSQSSLDLDEEVRDDENNGLKGTEQTFRILENESQVTLHPLLSSHHSAIIDIATINLNKQDIHHYLRSGETETEARRDSTKEFSKMLRYKAGLGTTQKCERVDGCEEDGTPCSVGDLGLDESADLKGFSSTVLDGDRDIVTEVGPAEREGQTGSLVEADHQLASPISTAASRQASVEKSSPVMMNKSKERKARPLYNNQSFNILAHRNPSRAILNPKRSRRKSSTASPVKIKMINTTDQDFFSGETFNKLDWPKVAPMKQSRADAPLVRKRTPDPLHHPALSGDKKILSKSHSQNHLLNREPATPRQSDHGSQRTKSALDNVSYSDMFVELNKGGEGPAIFQMFATPIYENLRASKSSQRIKQAEPSAPVKRQSNGQPRAQKAIEGNRRKQSQKGSRIKGKQQGKKRREGQAKGLHHPQPFEINKDEADIIQNQRRESGSAENKDISEKKTGNVGGPRLSVIEEVLSDATGTLVRHQQRDFTSLSHSVLKPCLGEQHLIELKTEACEDNGGVSREDEHPVADQLPAQPLINTWTSDRTVSPVYRKFLDGVGEGPVTDDLLRCLAEELISLEEREVETLKPENMESKKLVTGLPSKVKEVLNEGTSDKIFCIEKSSADDADTWTKGEVLGRGAYGTVYCGLTAEGKLIAVKQVTLDTSNSDTAEKEYEQLQREVDLLKNLHHPNIVEFQGTALSDNVISIFMEYVPGGSISSVLNRFGPLPEKIFSLYTRQILEGVAYLHSNRVIHRDVKGNNIMLMPTGIIKLIDFGCARRLNCLTHSHSELLKSVHGTPYWMAPEVINETGHGRKSDIWSVGCTVFEMATGKPPLAHMGKIAALFYIGARKGLMPSLPDEFSEEAKGFVQSCLISDQRRRPSAAELLRHPFVLHLRQPCSRSHHLGPSSYN